MSSPHEAGAPRSRVCRVTPKVKPPAPDVLAALDVAERKILKRILAEPAEYVWHELFDTIDAQPWLEEGLSDELRNRPASDDSGIHRLHVEGELPTDPETRDFLRFNYRRMRLAHAFEHCGTRRMSADVTREILAWHDAVETARGNIVRGNIALVMAMAKRTRVTTADPADLVSEGNLALLRAVNKFDSSRGYRFSTYACRAILKSFARVATRTSRYRGYFPTEFDPTLEKSDFVEQRRADVADHCMDELRSILNGEAGSLSDIERTVIRARFALDEDADSRKGKTLEQIGELIGVTKERVRQIQNKALGKLRAVLDEGVLA